MYDDLDDSSEFALYGSPFKQNPFAYQSDDELPAGTPSKRRKGALFLDDDDQPDDILSSGDFRGDFSLFSGRQADAQHEALRLYGEYGVVFKDKLASSNYIIFASSDIATQRLYSKQYEEHQSYFEVIGDRHVKLFFDIEGLFYADATTFFEILFLELHQIIESKKHLFVAHPSVLKRHLWENNRPCDDAFKWSYHVIYPNIVFNSMQSLKSFVDLYISPMMQKRDDNGKEVIDDKVYKPNRIFRTPLSHKDLSSGRFTLTQCYTGKNEVDHSVDVVLNACRESLVTAYGEITCVSMPKNDPVMSSVPTTKLVEKLDLKQSVDAGFLSENELHIFKMHAAYFFDKWKFEGCDEVCIGPPYLKDHFIHFDVSSSPYCLVCKKRHSSHNNTPGKRHFDYDIDTMTSSVYCFVAQKGSEWMYFDPHKTQFTCLTSVNVEDMSFSEALKVKGEKFSRRIGHEMWHCAKLVNDTLFYYQKSSKLWQSGVFHASQERLHYVNWMGEKLEVHKKRTEAAGNDISYLESCIENFNLKQGINSQIAKFVLPHLVDSAVQEKLDRSEFLLPICGERVIDLRTLSVRSRNIDDFFSKQLDVDFIPHEVNRVKKVDDFIRSLLFQPDWYNAFRCHLGYFLHANVNRERSYWIWVGDGRNGKSALTDMIEVVLQSGFLFFSTPKSFLIQSSHNNQEGHSTMSMELRKVRLLMIQELTSTDVIDTSKLKSNTGGDTIRGRSAYAKSSSAYVNITKWVLATNQIPNLNGSDKAVLDRTLVVNFDNRFESSEIPLVHARQKRADTELVNAIKEDKSALFTWFAQASKSYWDLVQSGKSLRDIWPIEWKRICDDVIDDNKVAQFTSEMVTLDVNVPAAEMMSSEMFNFVKEQFYVSILEERNMPQSKKQNIKYMLETVKQYDPSNPLIQLPLLKTSTVRFKNTSLKLVKGWRPKDHLKESFMSHPVHKFEPMNGAEKFDSKLIAQRCNNSSSFVHND